jgi:hypothetical protein
VDMKRWEKRVSGEQARDALKEILDTLSDPIVECACTGCRERVVEARDIAKRGLRRPKYTPSTPRTGGRAS